MLAALVDADVSADMVIGTSIGAINGAMLAADPTPDGIARLEQAWRGLAENSVLVPRRRDQLRNLLRLAPSLVSNAPLAAWLDEHLPVERFDELAIDFECVAASIERSAESWFSTGDLAPALLASSAIPGLFPPVEINGAHYYDGGLVNSVPISRAVERGATSIYVLQVGRVEQSLEVPTRWFEAGITALEISRRHRFATARENLPDGIEVHLLPSGHVLAPTDRRQLNWSDFGDTDELINDAKTATAAFLAELGGG